MDLFWIEAGTAFRAWQRANIHLGLGPTLPCQAVGAAVGAGGRTAGRRQELLPVQAVGSAGVFSWLTFKSGREAARVLIVAGS